MTRIRVFIAVAACLCSVTSPAAGQQRHFTCAEAARLVTAREVADTQARWAFSEIASCPDGPAAIATRWRTTESLEHLRTWNYMIRDQRIADAAIAVARDASRPPDLRLMAMETLVGYFDSSSEMRLEELRNPPRFPSLAHVTDVAVRTGTQPPAADMPDRIYALSRDLIADPNPTVARAAKAVWQALTDARPAIAVLPPGTLSLINVCGRRFRIANQSEIDFSVELIVSAGLPPRQHRIPARGSLDFQLAGDDTVRLLFAGHEVASAATGKVECH